jgi:hypothetical protein
MEEKQSENYNKMVERYWKLSTKRWRLRDGDRRQSIWKDGRL